MRRLALRVPHAPRRTPPSSLTRHLALGFSRATLLSHARISRVLGRERFPIHCPCRSVSYHGRKQTSERQQYAAYRFRTSGVFEEVKFKPADIKVHARDILAMSPTPLHVSNRHHVHRTGPNILPRQDCILLSISHIKAIIHTNQVLLLDVHRPVVKHFAQYLSQFLRVCTSNNSTVFGPHNPLPLPLELTDLGDMAAADYAGLQPAQAGETEEPPLASVGTTNAGEEVEVVAFEIRVLEAILAFVSKKYDRRLQCFEPVINNALHGVFLTADSIDSDSLHRLLPLKNSLTSLERSTGDLVTIFQELLNSDEDMVDMLLTEKARTGSRPPLEAHAEIELLLESYHRDVLATNLGAFYLRKKIQSSQDLMQIALDSYRNRMIKMDVQLAMGAVALGCSTAVAGLFGMNLHSGLETHPQAFYYVSLTCMGLTGLVIARVLKWIGKPNTSRMQDVNNVESVLNRFGDIQDIVLRHLHSKGSLTKAEFERLLFVAVGRPVDPQELDLIFKVFDKNSDGVLDDDDIRQFLCDLQSHHSNMRLN